MNPSLKQARARAALYDSIRAFFKTRDVLEVETPILSRGALPDPVILSFSTQYHGHLLPQGDTFYMQTSPEFPMKRLLAAQIGSIYQICKTFRNGEAGRWHNPEFTMLEWYRMGFNHHQLMDEMDALLQVTLSCQAADRITYRDMFKEVLGLDLLLADIDTLKQCAAENNIQIMGSLHEKDEWLNVLMSHAIEPTLGMQRPIFVYDFPASQAALARVLPGEPPVAARFEVYVKGIELANGFYELTDANEQRQRFVKNNQDRAQANMPQMPLDENFLQSLEQGMPDCSGVALGVDRLLALQLGLDNIQDILHFNWLNA